MGKVVVMKANGRRIKGSRYEGEWKKDKRDGKGRMIYLDDGRELKGWFKDNVFINKQ